MRKQDVRNHLNYIRDQLGYRGAVELLQSHGLSESLAEKLLSETYTHDIKTITWNAIQDAVLESRKKERNGA